MNLVAANYHTLENGKRKAFDSDAMGRDIDALKDLPKEIIAGVYLWYTHCDTWWQAKLTELYGESEKETEPSGKEIWSLIFQLSGNKIGTDFDQLQSRSRQQIYLALEEMESQRLALKES